MKTILSDKRNVMKWINALRSGKYKQGCIYLHNESTDEYCCLGVANKIFDLNESEEKTLMHTYKKLGLNDSSGVIGGTIWGITSLACLNDFGYTFNEIADIIQIEYIEGV